MRLPDLEAWAIFGRVAQLGSFGRAAQDLGLSKATVSKAVGRLEARLGTTLFHRTSRRVSITEAGRAAAVRAERILDEGQAAEAALQDDAAMPRGLVRLAAPMSFGLGHVAPILPDFLARFPHVAVDLHLSDAVVDVVAEGFDAALRITALADSSLRARRLCDVRRLLVAAPAYLDRAGRPQHPRDLEAHACLGYAYLPGAGHWRLLGLDGQDTSVAVTGPLRANNADALTPALLAGLGIAVQPAFTVWRELEAGQLEAVMPDWSPPPIGLNIVTPPGRLRPTRVTALIDFLAARLSVAGWASRPRTSA